MFFKNVHRFIARVVILVLITMVGLPQAAQADGETTLLWAKSMGGARGAEGNSIYVDPSGNVYATGLFLGTADFDPGPGEYNLTSAGAWEVFVSKLDANGDFVWARSMGGPDNDYGYSISLDPVGNVYTTGRFEGTADFDPGPGAFNLTSVGGDDIFVFKLDNNGNFLWAGRMGGMENYEAGREISVDSNGNVYMTGTFEGTADFDPGPGAFNLTSAGDDDIFISKLDTSGNFVWARNMGGMGGRGGAEGYGIALDSTGNVYTTGYFLGTVDFDPGAGVYYLSARDWDIFVSKLDNNGNFVSARSMGGTQSYAEAHGLALDTSGNVYTTGRFEGTVDFDPGPGIYNLTNPGSQDIFVSKLDTNGDFVWARRMGGMNGESGNGISVDTSGNVYTIGDFEGTVDFDPGPGYYSLVSASNDDIFVSKLDNNGNFVWAGSMGGISSDDGRDIKVDSSGNVYTTGAFDYTVDFDPGPGVFNLTSAADRDIFVSKFTVGVAQPDIFGDVASNYWATDYIERLYNSGITSGCSTTPMLFCPEDRVSRADMAAFLLKGIYGPTYSPPPVGDTTGFDDVPTDFLAAAWIKQLAADGITAGCGNGSRYCPDGLVLRSQMAVFLLKAKYGSSHEPPAATGVFGDVPTDHWAAAWIEQLAAEGITAGCGSGNYCPEGIITRSQMAVFLVKTFNVP